MAEQLAPKIFTLNGATGVPLYVQIKQNLHDLIEAQTLTENQILPSETELGTHYKVSRLTVRQAIVELVREGYLRRERGVGTFVAGPKLTQSLARVGSFSERMREANRQPASRVLSQQVIAAPANIAQQLALEPKSPVHKLERLRLANGEPVMIETAYLPESFFPGLHKIKFAEASLYRTLDEKFNCRIVAADETVEPVLITRQEAKALKTPAGSPGLLVHVKAFDQDGRIVEYSKSIVRGDRSRYMFHIKRTSNSEEYR